MTAKGESIRATRPQAVPRASKRYDRGRVCSAPGCDTQISIYNRRDRCWAHAEMKVPRLRGRNPAAAGV